jgi:MFS family permease
LHDLLPLLAATFAYGVSAGLFSVSVVSILQVQTVEDMRGRVMALYSICFLGVSLVSGPGFSGLAEWLGVSGALRVAASICAVVVVVGGIVWQATRHFGRAA